VSAEAVKDFGALAFEAVHQLQQEIRQLRAELEEAHRSLDMADSKIEALTNELARR